MGHDALVADAVADEAATRWRAQYTLDATGALQRKALSHTIDMVDGLPKPNHWPTMYPDKATPDKKQNDNISRNSTTTKSHKGTLLDKRKYYQCVGHKGEQHSID